MSNKSEEDKGENFRMFYLLQFDRIDKLESKREGFSNLVITISVGILAFIFSSDFHPTNTQRVLFGLIIIVINVISILFVEESHSFIKMHQNRATEALGEFAPELMKIKKKIFKPNSTKNPFSRQRLYSILHGIFAIIGIVIVCGLLNNDSFNIVIDC